MFFFTRHTGLKIFPFLTWRTNSFLSKTKTLPNVKQIFRFEKRDIPPLVEALGVPPIFICQNGTICDRNEALCIVLKRFAFPCYSDMTPIFGRSVPELSMISNEVVDWIYTTHGHKITQWNHAILNPSVTLKGFKFTTSRHNTSNRDHLTKTSTSELNEEDEDAVDNKFSIREKLPRSSLSIRSNMRNTCINYEEIFNTH